MLNRSEKCNYNPNLVLINKIPKRFLCVHQASKANKFAFSHLKEKIDVKNISRNNLPTFGFPSEEKFPEEIHRWIKSIPTE